MTDKANGKAEFDWVLFNSMELGYPEHDCPDDALTGEQIIQQDPLFDNCHN